MKLSDKLDTLQRMAQEFAGEPGKLYLVGLLAEHAEEEECTGEVIEWVGEVLHSSYQSQEGGAGG